MHYVNPKTANIFSMTIANGSPGLQNCEGEWGEPRVTCQNLMKQHPMLFCTLPPGNRD